MQLLTEPSIVVISVLGLLAFAAASLAATAPAPPARSRPARAAAAAWRVLVPTLVAAALATVQLLPTAVRLAGTSRAEGLAAAEATLWSSPPERLVETAFPRFFGDPSRNRARGCPSAAGCTTSTIPTWCRSIPACW